MKFIENFENACKKIESFFVNIDFIPRLFTSMGVGLRAFNDSLLKRNEQELKTYLNDRK